MFLIRGRTVHFFRERRRIGLVNVQFDPDRLPLPLEWLRKLEGYRTIFDSASGVVGIRAAEARRRATFHRAGDCQENWSGTAEPAPGTPPAALALLLELIVFLSRCFGAPPLRNSGTADRIGKAVTLIEREYFRSWTLDELARHCATSPNTLLRWFREAVGTTPVDYLIRVRLRPGGGTTGLRRDGFGGRGELRLPRFKLLFPPFPGRLRGASARIPLRTQKQVDDDKVRCVSLSRSVSAVGHPVPSVSGRLSRDPVWHGLC